MINPVGHIASLVLVAGLSGAGKSRALDILSDLGFYTVENLPVAMLPGLIEFSKKNPEKYVKTAILPEIDSPESVQELDKFIAGLGEGKDRAFVLFLHSETDTLVRRYSETRRPHPNYSAASDTGIEAAIFREKERLEPVKSRANLVIDTTKMTVHDLKRELSEAMRNLFSVKAEMNINILTFGFKHGLPQEADLVVDVRFLPNPFFVDELREKTGLEPEVSRFVLSQNEAQEFLSRYSALVNYLLPHYVTEGKAYVTIGVGCTGGKHRSVAIAEALAQRISGVDCRVNVKHRDMLK